MLLFHQIPIPWYYFVLPEIHMICHQFPTAWENAAQPILLERNRTLTLILLPRYGSFCSMKSPSYVIQHFMVRTWVFPRVFRSMTKFSNHMGRTWNINTHTLLKIRGISLPSNSRLMGYWKKTIFALVSNISLLPDLVPTEWDPKDSIRTTSHYVELGKHLKVFFVINISM